MDFKWMFSGFLVSELQAVCDTMHYLSQADIVTDSMYVIDAVQTLSSGISEADILNYPNGDLLMAMSANLNNPAKKFWLHKVKSHQDLQPTMDPRDLLFALGNEAADHAAKEARQVLADGVRYEKQEEAMKDFSFLEAHYELCVSLNRVRVQLEGKKPKQNEVKQTDLHQMLAVQIDEPYVMQVPDFPPPWLAYSLWGQGLSEALLTWLLGLKWPSDAFEQDSTMDKLDPGITWLELLLDFQQTTQSIFSQNRAKRAQPLQLVTPTIHEDCHEGDMHMFSMIRGFQTAIAHLSKLADCSFIPPARKTVKTLYCMGAGHQPKGVAVRPELWHPEEVQHILTNFFRANPRTWTFPEILKFSAAEPKIVIAWTSNERQPRHEEGQLRRLRLKQFLQEKM